MLLFLDFDGVLRRKQAPLYKLESDLVQLLIGLLREYSRVEVVVTSSWTDAYPLNQIKELFPRDISLRIVGKTTRRSSQDEHARYREVLAYLDRFADPPPWVALDDDPLNYPDHAAVVLVDPGQGLDDSSVKSLRDHFNKATTET